MTTTSDAVSQILQSSAPGQWDDVAIQLGKLGGTVDPSLKQANLRSRGIGIPTSSSTGHPLTSILKEKYTQHVQTAFLGIVRGGVSKEITTRVWIQDPPSSNTSILELCSYAEKLDLQNLQTGQWKSTWRVSDTNELSGTVEVHSYAFEDGNTQFQWTKTFEPIIISLEGGGEEEENDAKKIVSQFIRWEHEILSILRGLQEVTPESLKKIRRVLPITKMKMNWEVEAQRGVQHLKRTTKER